MRRITGILFVLCCYSGEFANASCFGSLQKYYTDCNEAYMRGETCSGVYTIKPDNYPPFDVYCDMDSDDGGWTVFQRRMDGNEDFYRGWKDYNKGFGDLNGEFWLGLNKIYRLTRNSDINTTLRVDLEGFDGVKLFAKYDQFKVLDYSNQYQLVVAGYSGDAGDSLSYHSHFNFSTKDHLDVNRCANLYKGAWWYDSCHVSNLNGLYHPGPHDSYADGVNWEAARGYHYSFMFSEMKLRLNVTGCGSPQEYPGADIQYTTMTYQSVATYKCRIGYELDNQTPSLTQECQDNGTWTGMTPICNPIDCGDLPQIPNGQVIVRSTKFGSIATYKCDHGYEFVSGEESSYKRTCQSDKTWSGTTPTCQFMQYSDCQDAFSRGETTSGIYTIYPDSQSPFDVYCDMDTDGGGWIVFQRREDGSEDFYRGWNDYEIGFGNLSGEFWLGLSKIHRLTRNTSTLRIDLADFEGNSRFAKYATFEILDASTMYQLNVTEYSGDATDSLIHNPGGLATHQGRKFSTKDRDNDVWGNNCAVQFHGAWWYHACHRANLNGQYLSGSHSSYANGVEWVTWKGFYYSLRFTEMKLRKK